jgi:hypothetical protein
MLAEFDRYGPFKKILVDRSDAGVMNYKINTDIYPVLSKFI